MEFLEFYDPTEKEEEEKWTHISIFGVGSGRGGRRIEDTGDNKDNQVATDKCVLKW